jgi:hypothetical protein
LVLFALFLQYSLSAEPPPWSWTKTDATATLVVTFARKILRQTRLWGGSCFVRQPKAGQRHPGKTDAEFLQRRAARNGLCQALG